MIPRALQLLAIILLLFVFSATQSIGQTSPNPLTYIRVETIDNNQGQSGLFGGVLMRIVGSGFNSVPQNNIVTVDDIPCKVFDGEENALYFISPPHLEKTTFGVEVSVPEKQPYACYNCFIDYKYDKTPLLNKIYPKSGTINSRTQFIGNHKIFLDPINPVFVIYSLSIGNSICSVDGIDQNMLPSEYPIFCDVSNQEAGFYAVTSWMIKGYAKKLPAMLVWSLFETDLTYEYVVHPIVESVSTHAGSSQGNKLTISGTGFSTDPSKIDVKVASIPCHVTSSTYQQITCTVAADLPGNNHGRLPTQSAQQKEGFASGSGFTHDVYDLTQLSKDTPSFNIDSFRTLYTSQSPTLIKVASSGLSSRSFLGELEVSTTDFNDLAKQFSNGKKSFFGTVSKGYFAAPKTGTYKFSLSSLTNVSIYKSSEIGSTEITYTTPFLKSSTNHLFTQQELPLEKIRQLGDATLSSSVDLTQGDYVYFEIFVFSSSDFKLIGANAWNLNVEITNSDAKYTNTVQEVQKIEITAEQVFLTAEIEHIGATKGYFLYTAMIPETPIVRTIYVPFDATAEYLLTAGKNYLWLESSAPTIERQAYDSDFALITTPGKAVYKYKYIVKFMKPITLPIVVTISNYNAKNTLDNTITPTATYRIVAEPSERISGTFKLSFNGVILGNLAEVVQPNQYRFQTESQSQVLEKIMYTQFGVTVRVNNIVEDYKKVYFVHFYGFKGTVPRLQATDYSLRGGKQGQSPDLSVTVIRAASTNVLYEPISFEFLNTPSATPSVIVTVNKAKSQCRGDCSYSIVNTGVPTITSASLATNIITLVFDTDVPIKEVTFAGQPCTDATGDNTGYECSLPNQNGGLQLEAGQYLPTVMIENKGFALYDEALVKIDVPLEITSLTPDTGEKNGGTLVTMAGTGFPLNSQKTFTLTMCDVEVETISVSNTEIKFYSVACEDDQTTVKLTFNTKEATSTYTYTAASAITIASISPPSHSPVLKGFMTVTGTGFGIDKSLLKAWLTKDGANIYQLNVLEADDTTLKLRIPGGESGEFRVKVLLEGTGFATLDTVDANKFDYGIYVSSITPTTGSKFGGTVLTIAGSNFSPDLEDNSVVIGSVATSQCEVLTATPTQITCRTPTQDPSYDETPLLVTVIGLGYARSKCQVASCNFAYTNAASPTLSNAQNNSNHFNQDSIVLTGTKLKNGGAVAPKVFVGDTEATVTASSDTSATFTFPALSYGTYPLHVYVDQLGYASSSYVINSDFRVTTNAITASTFGNLLTITGSGFVPPSNPNLVLTFTSMSSKSEIKEITPTKIIMEVGTCNDQATFNIDVNFKFTPNVIPYTCSSVASPVVALTSSAAVAYNAVTQTIGFQKNSPPGDKFPITAVAYPVDTDNARIGNDIPLTITQGAGSAFTVDGKSLLSGKYKFRFLYQDMGYAQFDGTVEIQLPNPTLTVSSIQSGYNGGPEITVAGAGLSLSSKLIVGGRVEAEMDKAKSSNTELFFKAPAYLSKSTNQAFDLVKQILLVGKTYTKATDNSKVEFDFGKYQRALITRIKYRISRYGNPPSLSFKASNDKNQWTTMVSTTPNQGWSIKTIQIPTQFTSYRYCKLEIDGFQNTLTELYIYGNFVSEPLATLTSNPISVDFTDGFHSLSSISTITYQSAITPVVQSLFPYQGSPLGAETLTITGTGFGTTPGDVKVLIDAIPCVVGTTSETEIVCTTGVRTNAPATNTFSVTVNSNKAVMKTDPFIYVSKWSEDITWGGDFAPVEGDTVYVPEGMTLVVDQSTPKLQYVLVEGTIIFADESPLVIQAETIFVSGGKFIAGTQSTPHLNDLTFILSGTANSKQLPFFGNKMIGCYNCELDINGKVRNFVWTELDQTADANANEIHLTTAVDWVAGEKIVIASTSFDPSESEERTIQSIDGTMKIITLDKPLLYAHKSATETFGTETVNMRAEVGLLTRNIKIQGNSDSAQDKYGSHLLMTRTSGNGLISRISYTEFSNCGQEKTAKSCISFIKNQDMTASFVKGNSIHSSFARAITLSASSYLTIENNVGYQIAGNGIFLETGAQQFNTIDGNLIISTISTSILSQSQIYPSCFYISNPLNTIKNNRAVGSEGNGFNYRVEYSKFWFSKFQVIPTDGDNVAHSNRIAGLQLYNADFLQRSVSDPEKITFKNFVLWNNEEYGVHLNQGKNVIFNNLNIVNFGRSGIFIKRQEKECNQKISVFDTLIALSTTNTLTNMAGITMSGPSTITGVTFANFPVQSTLFQIPQSTTLQNIFNLKQIKIVNVLGRYASSSNDPVILKVEDNSLSSEFVGAPAAGFNIIGPNSYNKDISTCILPTTASKWAGFILCPADLQLSVVTVQSDSPSMKVTALTTDLQEVTLTAQTPTISSQGVFFGGHTYSVQDPDYQGILTSLIMTGCTTSPTDAIVLRFKYTSKYETIQGNYNGVRQNKAALLDKATCDFGDIHYTDKYLFVCISERGWRAKASFEGQYKLAVPPVCPGDLSCQEPVCPGHATCVPSEEPDCTEGVDCPPEPCTEGVDCPPEPCTEGVDCPEPCTGDDCPEPCTEGVDCPPEPCTVGVDCPPDPEPVDDNTLICTSNTVVLNWSNITNWSGKKLPIAGDNVTIAADCNILLDANAENLNHLHIRGTLTVKDQNTVISAKFIWVMGVLQAGTAVLPFQSNLTIKLLGTKTDPVYNIDSTIGWGKAMVVTGKLNLYGKVPTTPRTRLTLTAAAGMSYFNVASTAGLASGQTLEISPSLSNFYQYEKITIQGFTPTTVTFSPPFKYTHYGAAAALTNAIGDIDMRSIVTVLNRNIQIVNDNDAEDWSYSVLVYGLNSSATGSAVLNSVQFKNGGQFNSDRAALNIINTAIGTAETIVTNSVFDNCINYCVYLKNSKLTTFQNNSLMVGQRYLVYAEGASSHLFKNNVLVGARNRTNVATAATETIACYHQNQNAIGTNVTVIDNTCQGSQGSGFIIPFVECADLSATTGYSGNTVGSAKAGFVVTNNAVNGGCKASGYHKAYGCEVGITSNPTASSVTWDKLILADNKRAIGLRFGVNATNNTSTNNLDLKNSWISAVSRLNCEDCYGPGKTSCSDNSALRLLVVTRNGNNRLDDTIQQIYTPQELDANAWISNVIFQNFKLSYSTLDNNLSTVCSNNRLFEVHPQADSAIGNHHLTNTTCTGCDNNSYGYFSAPIQANLGNAGGCGGILCTGRNNYLIVLHDTSLLSSSGYLVPSNTFIGTLGCTFNALSNSNYCNRTDLGRLKFVNIAKDFQTRVMWPVSLTKENSTATQVINGWKEYEWNGTEPLNKRMGRFLSLIQFNQCYNMSFTAQPPSDMLFSFSLPTRVGDNSKWACIKLYYPVPNSIVVKYTDGTTPKSILSTSSEEVISYPTVCGAHKYLYKSSAIHFMLTANANCVVRVTLTSSVQVTAVLNIDIAAFNQNGGEATLLSQLSTFLNVVVDRLKVIGVYSGSTIVDFTISPVLSSVDNSEDSDPASAEIAQDLKNLAALASSATGTNIPGLVGISAVTTIMDPSGEPVVDPTTNQSGADPNTKYIIIGCVVGGAVLILLIILIYCLCKKLRQSSPTDPDIDQPSMEKIEGGNVVCVQLEKVFSKYNIRDSKRDDEIRL